MNSFDSVPTGTELVSVPMRAWVLDPTATVVEVTDGVVVKRGDMATTLVGAGMERFVSELLDSSEQFRIVLPGGWIDRTNAERLENLLKGLEDSGLLHPLKEDSQEPVSAVSAGLWARTGQAFDLHEIESQVSSASVEILGSGTEVELVAVGLEKHNIDVTLRSDVRGAIARLNERDVHGPAPLLTIIVGQSEDDPLLLEWNETVCALDLQEPWLSVISFDGRRATVGPWVLPGTSACFKCYQLRRASVFPDAEIVPMLSTAEPALRTEQAEMFPGMSLIVAGLVVDRVLDFAGLRDQSRQAIPGGLTTVKSDASGISQSNHRVLRVPRCPTCSQSAGMGYPQVWYGRPVPTAKLEEV